jgi:DNA-binding transcriptional LysR family regulator
MLDIRRLRLLYELHERGTLTAVADALSFTPSSVSQQLALLEKETGVALLRKAGRRVQLTPEALILVAHTGRLLDRLEQAESDLAAVGESIAGTVRIAVFQSAAHAFIPQALSILGADYPDLRVEVTEREPEVALFDVSAREFDLVIAEQYPGHTRAFRADLDRVELCTDSIRLATPPIDGRVPEISSLGAARDAAWVMEPPGTASRQWAMQLCRSHGFEPDVRFETADLMAHIRLIKSGNAVGLLPGLVWAGEPPTVRLCDLPGSPSRTVFTSARTASAARPAVRACRDALTRAVAATTMPLANAHK